MPTSSTPTAPEAAHASEEPLDLLALAKTDVSHPLAPPLLRAALSSPPFVALPGSFNTRDLGLLPGSPLPPGLAYRSGGFFFLGGGGGGGGPDAPKEEAENANAASAAALVDRLRVRKVFDLRSAAERERAPDPAVAGVEGVWVRPDEKDAEVDLAAFVEGEGEKGYAAMYLDVLRVYQGGFRKVLEHVRDRRGEPFLFHCTAGRDRTGVMAGLLLKLAGASPETVVLDFLLSRIGTESAREQLIGFALKESRAANMDAAGFRNLCNLKVSCWEAFVRAVEREYGGFEGYVTGVLGFSETDLAKIKDNLVLGK